MRLAFRVPLAILLALPLCFGILRTSRLTRADILADPDTVDALQSAIRLEPANAEYHARIATLNPAEDDELRLALQLKPWSPSWWIMRSVHAEETGDLPAAEADLLKANSVAQLYKPRWTLAFFYYRQQNREAFAKWARATLSVGFGDSDSIFRMASRLGFSSAEVLDRIVPDDPEKVAALLYLAFSSGNAADVSAPALRLIGLNAQTHRDDVLHSSLVLYRGGLTSEATNVWNRAVRAGWISFSPLDPAAGKSQARTNFRGERIEKGFDWRYPATNGVAISVAEPDGSLRAELSGNEPEKCEIVAEDVPLLPGREYTLSSSYRTESIRSDTGLQWSVLSLKTGQVIATLPLSDPPAPITFRTPSGAEPMSLSLRYIRNPGTTRPEGTLWVKSVELNLVP